MKINSIGSTPRLLFALLFLAGSWINGAAVAETPKMDVRILIDVSGSMKKTDPQNLRRPSVRLLVGLLPEGSRAGIWSFAQTGKIETPLGTVNAAWKRQAISGAERIHSKGLFTNIEDALMKAVEDWKPDEQGYRRNLVLMTDGMVDVSSKVEDSVASKSRIENHLLPRLKSMGIQVHTIALSEEADQVLMRKVAEETGGWYQQADDADALQRAFLRMFEQLGHPDTVPLSNNQFQVDNQISEFTLLIFRKKGVITQIESPEGRMTSASTPTAEIMWYQDEGYDLLTVTKPTPGTWKIHGPSDPDNRAMIVTDLKMELSPLPMRVAKGQRLPMNLQFTEAGKRLVQSPLLRQINVEMCWSSSAGAAPMTQLQDDGTAPDSKASDGLFETLLNTDRTYGAWELLVSGVGSTFNREKRHFLEVMPAALAELIPDEQNPMLQRLLIKPVSSVIDPASLWPAVELMQGDRSLSAVDIAAESEGKNWSGTIDTTQFSGDAELRIKLTAKALTGDPVRSILDPVAITGTKPGTATAAPAAPAAAEPPTAPPQPGIDTTRLLIGFGIGNLLLLLAVGGVIWFLKKRRKSAGTGLEDEESASA